MADMTREEAKEILEEVKTIDDSMYQYSKKYLQALDMAISDMDRVAKLKAKNKRLTDLLYEQIKTLDSLNLEAERLKEGGIDHE